MIKKLSSRFVPIGSMRYSTEQQLRLAFEKMTGRTVEQAFDLWDADKAKIKVCFDVIDEKYGPRIFSGEGAALTEAVADLTEFIVYGSPLLAENDRGARIT